jgi:hypothetical protein
MTESIEPQKIYDAVIDGQPTRTIAASIPVASEVVVTPVPKPPVGGYHRSERAEHLAC